MTDPSQSITLTIENSDELLYSGTVAALTCINDKGPFDILPFHANFISLIKEKIIVHEQIGQTKDYAISQGVLKVYDNVVKVFVGIN